MYEQHNAMCLIESPPPIKQEKEIYITATGNTIIREEPYFHSRITGSPVPSFAHLLAYRCFAQKYNILTLEPSVTPTLQSRVYNFFSKIAFFDIVFTS